MRGLTVEASAQNCFNNVGSPTSSQALFTLHELARPPPNVRNDPSTSTPCKPGPVTGTLVEVPLIEGAAAEKGRLGCQDVRNLHKKNFVTGQ